jgi:hypothetical protein
VFVSIEVEALPAGDVVGWAGGGGAVDGGAVFD